MRSGMSPKQAPSSNSTSRVNRTKGFGRADIEDCIGLENLLAASFQLEVRLEKADAQCAAEKLDKSLFKETIRDTPELAEKREADVLQVFDDCGVYSSESVSEQDTQEGPTSATLDEPIETAISDSAMNNDEWAVADKISEGVAAEMGNVPDPVLQAQDFDCYGERLVNTIGVERLAELGITKDAYNSPEFLGDEEVRSYQVLKECFGLKSPNRFFPRGRY